MVRYCRRRIKLKFLVAVVSIIGLLYIIYQVKSVQELTQKSALLKKPVRGVHYTLITRYNGDTFTCLFDRAVIDSDKVNDDYCDCEDGTDEPGTAACSNGKFYCEADIYKRNAVPIPSGRVNDGICDCCDGSDEWKKIRSPFKLPDDVQKKIGTYLSPCLYSCW